MKFEIQGGNLPFLTCSLSKGESVFTESGGMSWMTGNIEMLTNTKGGVLKGLGRVLAGESLFMNTFICKDGEGEISFTSCFPGEIMEFDLKDGESVICQKKAFLCAESSVNMEMKFSKKIGAGLFGGEGFIMQKITGPGKAFVEIDGSIKKMELVAGQTLKVDGGYIAAMSESVNLDVTMVKGLKNIVLGGEGLFLSTLTGPGTVYLQSMPTNKLAGIMAPYFYKG